MVLNNLNQSCYKCLKEFHPSEERMHGLHLRCFQQWFDLPNLMDFQDLILNPLGIETSGPGYIPTFHTVNASFFQGRFKKYSATLNGEDYILKVQQSDYPALPATEYLCNQIANLLKIKIPEYFFIRLQNTMDTFVVKNFMQKIYGGNFIHIYHYLKNPSDFNCHTLLRIIQEKTQRFEDVIYFIEMCIFDALIGNDDRHGRNLGFIETTRGLTLAPLYDNVSYLGREEEWLLEADHNPRGRIGTLTTTEPTMKDYMIEFRRLGFQDVIYNLKNAIKLESVCALIEKSFISQPRKEAIIHLISRRHREMLDE